MQAKLSIKLTAGCEKLKSNHSNAKNASPTTCNRSKKALKAADHSVSRLQVPVTRQRDRAGSRGEGQHMPAPFQPHQKPATGTERETSRPTESTSRPAHTPSTARPAHGEHIPAGTHRQHGPAGTHRQHIPAGTHRARPG